ncbi:MAG TPA: N-acetylmuramoyl-L-alanine amidase [Streptosporangiaceae bacterium]|jgi:hypothetical protein
MTVPGKLQVSHDGKITGPARISYNDPFPTKNGKFGSGEIMGVVMHTMVGDLPGTISLFNNPAPGGDPRKATSAHFGIAQDGSIHQFGPIGKGWIAWAQVEGNDAWYSIEHADHANTENALTQAQVDASAQLVEVLSRFAGFPLQVTNQTGVPGYGTHVMGGASWGGHTCPGPGPRAGQRAAIIALAKQIRAGLTGDWHTTGGRDSLAELCARQRPPCKPSTVLRMTAQQSPDGVFQGPVASWLNDIFAGKATAAGPVPEGLRLYLPG